MTVPPAMSTLPYSGYNASVELQYYNTTAEYYSVVVNSTADSSQDVSLMESQYGRRFLPYTVLAGACILLNVLSLLALGRIRTHRTVHHVLLVNLAVCDIVGSALLWMYYNSPLLFPHFAVTALEHCLFITVVLVAPFILSLCNSLCSLLMLALNQYVAICDPIFSATKITKHKVQGGVALAWLASAALASIPALVMLFYSQHTACQVYVAHISVRSLEICAYALAALIIIIVALYARIYRVVIVYRRSTPPIRRHRPGLSPLGPATGPASVASSAATARSHETNYKAFVTTLMLVGNLVLFWLPYMVFHFISAHVDIEAMPDWTMHMKFYFVDFLPVLNFLTDPVIYGIRMREVRLGYRRLLAQLLPCAAARLRDPPRRRHCCVSRHTTIRFTALDNTTSSSHSPGHTTVLLHQPQQHNRRSPISPPGRRAAMRRNSLGHVELPQTPTMGRSGQNNSLSHSLMVSSGSSGGGSSRFSTTWNNHENNTCV